MRLFQQQRKPPVLQAFHSTALLHLFDLLHSVGASPAASGEPFALPPGSATVRVSGAAEARRGVLEVQVLGALGPTQALWLQRWADAAPRCSGCSVTLQLLLCCNTPKEGELWHRLCEREEPSWEQQSPGVGWSWGHFASDHIRLTNLGDLSCEIPVSMPQH